MEYSCLFCGVGTQEKVIFFKSSRKFRRTKFVNTVNEFMDLCKLELQQNNAIEVHGYYTKRTHVIHYYTDNKTLYIKRPSTVTVGWKTLRDKFKRRFGDDVEILHKKYASYIIVQNASIGSNLLKDI